MQEIGSITVANTMPAVSGSFREQHGDRGYENRDNGRGNDHEDRGRGNDHGDRGHGNDR
jgi:hypothetical protein